MSDDDLPNGVPAHLRAAASWVQQWCRDDRAVRCAYLGGSLATDRADTDSDLDVMLHATADDAGALFDRLLAAVAADWQVRHRWILPLPTWHGGRQAFFAVCREDGGPYVVLDVVIFDLAHGGAESHGPDATAPVRVDPRRDGTPLVLHDPDGLLHVQEHGDDEYRAAATAAIDGLAQRLPFARWIVEKSIRREQWPEAYSYYLRFALEPVVVLLRAARVPARWDFGLRYLDTDLAPADRDRIVALLPHGPDALLAQTQACLRWQEELLAARQHPPIGE